LKRFLSEEKKENVNGFGYPEKNACRFFLLNHKERGEKDNTLHQRNRVPPGR